MVKAVPDQGFRHPMILIFRHVVRLSPHVIRAEIDIKESPMERMVTHCKIVPYNSDEPNICKYRYTPNELPPFEAVRIILEQSLYWSYLDTMCQGNSITDLYENVRLNYISLPDDISSANQGLRELYHLGKAAIEDILKKNYDAVRYEDCFAVFSTDCPKDQEYHDYKCTLTQSFLNFWFLNVGKGVLPVFAFPKMQIEDPEVKQGVESFGEQAPTNVITDVALYLPSAKIIKNYDSTIPDSENHNYQVCFNLEARPVQAFHIEENQFGHRSLWAMLSRIDFNRCSVDDLIGVIASFSVNHDNYVMNLNDPDTPVCIVDLCYDLVTGSSPMYSNAGAVKRPVLGHEEFIQLVKYLLDTHRLQPLQEYGLFGALLESLGTDPNIVNYFVRPDEAITGEEAYAFRTSRYASIIKDRLAVVGMEAADDDAPDDETEDTPDEGAEEGEADTPAMDPTEDPGAALGEDTLTDEPEEEADNRPEIDPDKMLLELAAPNETMADYIYREMVNRRITAILQNPPESARPNDLLMLKRWKSRWLYLTSIACLRDFLSRVNIRLSETIS